MPVGSREWINEHDHRGASDLLRAVKIAFKAHSGQTDKAGEPYFSHCKRVADAVEGDNERIVGFLHDVVEKGAGWTLVQLAEAGFSTEIVEAVDALTRHPEETDQEFVTRAAENRLARPIKVADLRDNLTQAQKAGADTSKYEEGLRIIEIMEADAKSREQDVPQ
ncbi:HD domain-containing protein [Rhizobium tibeticum]|uniref:HD domain-containing protein n=1 Tax=Rhizobium tibeticum TaxID=501024 RepID=A0A1H8L1R2_9HYPH|nr:HD domain-containing protein [Rhizobium tibeticum]SEH85549.1 RelA/SpoT family protein [Rhizobium tibeticum]SEN99083.1 HD domain-containing protein [Rhizobium tibeticum]